MKCSCGGEYRCDTCGAKVRQPTQRQIQAYLLVHIHGFTQEQAGERMGVECSAVSHLLRRLGVLRPMLFTGGKNMTRIIFSNCL